MDQGIRNITQLDWITLVITGCFFALAVLKYIYPRKFEDFLLIISSDKFFSDTIKGYSYINIFSNVLLYIQWIITSLFIYIGYCYYAGVNLETSYITYFYILCGYVVFDLSKIVVERFIGYLVGLKELIKIYTYRKIMFKNFIGLILIIFCTILIYNYEYLQSYYSIFLAISIFIYALSILFTVRKFQSEILHQPSYFILYFCTLEIAPYYVMYKVFI